MSAEQRDLQWAIVNETVSADDVLTDAQFERIGELFRAECEQLDRELWRHPA